MNAPFIAPEEVAEQRYAVCQACPHFIELTTQCGKCLCVMKAKVKLQSAACPEGHW